MKGERIARAARTSFVLGVLILACAQPYPPPGGPADRDAPRLLSTRPEQRAVVERWNDDVVFRFDETLSERGVRDAVMVSPETGRPVLERDGSDLKVRIEGGWKQDKIYRVIIKPGIQDRFNNARREPTELVFSTGPELLPTAIAGLVSDRITGRPLAEMRVVAFLPTDTLTVNATVTDTAGFFGLRYLPLGRFTVRAFEDRNRNGRPDFSEKQAEQLINLATASDTQSVVFELLVGDTTPARVVRAEARDSLDVRVFFDDYIDPAKPMTGGAAATSPSAVLFLLPDSIPFYGSRIMHVRAFEAMRLAQRRDTTGAAPRPPAPVAPAADTVARPTQEVVVVPPAPLKAGARYRVELQNITNLNGVPKGGGSARFELRAPAARDTTARDTTVRRDTISLSEHRHFR